MESLLLSIKVIFPIVTYMAIGYFFKTIKVASLTTFKEMNKLTFRCFLPLLVFYNIYESDIRTDFSPMVLFFAIAAILIEIGLSILLVKKGHLAKDDSEEPVMIQGMYRSNFVLFGMEITRTICGADRMGMSSILVAVIIPLYNACTVVLFESYGGKKKGIAHIVKSIFKNPLIIASLLGLLVKFTGITLQSDIAGVVSKLGNMATPIALISLGGTFFFSRVAAYKKQLTIGVFMRLVGFPLFFVIIAVLLGIRGANLIALMVLFASPVAVSSYSMAAEMGGNDELAGMLLVISSLCSIITMFLWVYCMSALGLIP